MSDLSRRRYTNLDQHERGFSLLELMVIMLIIAILLGVALATYVATTAAANGAACRGNQQVLNRASALAVSIGSAVDDFEDLRPYVKNFDTVITCPLDGAPLDFAPATGEVTCPNHP